MAKSRTAPAPETTQPKRRRGHQPGVPARSRPRAIRDPSLALPAEIRERMRLRATELGVDRLVNHLGIDRYPLVCAIAGIPMTVTTARVYAAVMAKGLP